MDLICSNCGVKLKVLGKKVFPCAKCALINNKEIYFCNHGGMDNIVICNSAESLIDLSGSNLPCCNTTDTSPELQKLDYQDIIHYQEFSHGDPEYKRTVIDLLTAQRDSYSIDAVVIIDIIKTDKP